MIRRPPRSTLFPTRRSSDLSFALGLPGFVLINAAIILQQDLKQYALAADRKSTRLNSSHVEISYAVFCLKKKKIYITVLVYIKTTVYLWSVSLLLTNEVDVE